ncbi:MAG: family 78 glycoside hydrolase catalytic domain [Thermoguttaceae bacterium]|nr:family 78 glycoside hydrolase catalytic domain [Thermoguttaceae bacterium]
MMRRFAVMLALVAGAAWLPSVSQGAPAQPEQLRCEGLANPLGIDETQPRFCWALPPGERGLAQSAYELLVADSPKALAAGQAALWNSGKVQSNQSQWVSYAGAPLAKGSRCWWKVRVWDQKGEPSPWSETASFTVGPLSASDWSGEWIGADWMKNNEGPLPWLRKTITLDKVPTVATAYVCALGYYELYVNGQKVGDDVLSPAVSDYGKRGLYLTHDITKHLVEGKNCIGLWLGRGWSLGVLKNASLVGPMVKAEFDLAFDGSGRSIITTDATWKVRPSHITPLGKGTSGSYGGERVEADKEIADWSAADYDDSDWQPAAVHHPPTPVIAAQMMEPNRLLDEIQLAAVEKLDDGFVLDMGRNYTGWFELKLPDEVERGTTIAMEFADKRFPDGRFQTYGQRSEYVARGGGGERFRNRFNYAAFRYAIVKGLPRAPQPGEVKGWLVTTNYEPGSTFSCNNALLNQVHNMMCWTYQCLSLGGYTVDCPHRERLGYGGDSGTSMEMGMLNFRTGPFYAKWAADWRDAQNEEGDVPYTAPYSQDAGGGPVWSGFCITMPWQIYLTYADRRPLERSWPVMKKWLAFIDTKMGDGLLQPYVGIGCAGSPQWNFLGDWVPPGRKQGKDRVDDRSTLFFNNCYLVYCLQIASKIGHILGDDAQADIYAEKARQLAARLHERFLNDDGATYANGEQTYLVMPLLFGITPPDVVPQVMGALERDITVTRNGHLNTGMHGNYFMAKYLIEHGRNDLLALMHTKEDFPSFGHMIRSGATTIWEEWDGDNSQIHNTMISVGLWFIEGLAGIRYDERAPGFRHFVAAPGIESGLEQVDASLTTGYGKITSAWRVEGDTLAWELGVPPNTTATVAIPATALDAVREDGRPVGVQPGISRPAVEKGVFRADVSSGQYRFTSRIPK